MSLPSTWRQFQLFDFLPIRDPEYKSSTPLFSDPTLSAITAVQSHLAFAVQNAVVKIISKKSWTLEKQFHAYDADYNISFMRSLPHSNIILTLAEKQGAPAVIKIWDLHKIVRLHDSIVNDEEAAKTKYITQVQIHDGDNSFPISCVSFNDSLTCIAIGYTSGRVVLVRGDLLRDRGSKQRLIYDGSDPITGVYFNRTEDVMYVITTSKIFTLLSNGRNKGKPLRILSRDAGAGLHCSDIENRSSRLLIADSEGITYFNHVSKAQVVSFGIEKRRILRLFKDYLLMVCSVDSSQPSNSKKILVLDLHNMHISFSLNIPNSSVSHLFASSSDNEAYLLSTDGVLYRIHEKPINQQVELIMQRNLFSIALNLAKQYDLDKRTILRINRAHADFLYENQDYDNSILKYIDCLPLFDVDQTIKGPHAENIDDFVIEVITKFKEASNIQNMTKFLSEMYKLQLADTDHITLLLCCFCKLKMTEDLDYFIKNLDLSEESQSTYKALDLSKLNFPLIINLFKECGYFSQVISLLYKLNHPGLIVGIQLNDLKEYQSCMSYIKTLPVNELLNILIEYSKDLLDELPQDTTQLLIDVFTGRYKPETPGGSPMKSEIIEQSESDISPVKKPESSYVGFFGYLAGGVKNEEQRPEVSSDLSGSPTYLPPRPSLVFSCFIKHPKEFVVFLEACNKSFDKYQGNMSEKQDLILTLFDMYLSSSLEDNKQKEEWTEKAIKLLEENLSLIDKARASVIAHIYGLDTGVMLVDEDVGKYYAASFESAQMLGDFEQCFKIVQDHGESDPNLYKKMLKFVCSSKDVFTKASQKNFRFLLDNIDKHKIMTPLEVIKVFGSSDHASIGVIKNYLIDYISACEKETANNARLIESYENESTKASVELTELSNNPFILKAGKCSSCELKIEFPAIYFKCKHMYHQLCLDENNYIPDASDSTEPKCPLCSTRIHDAQAARSRQLSTKNDYDVFKMKVDDTTDKLKVISEYIGRGAMESSNSSAV